jgi:predicted signal transduction protein with EAL and GGDEF domain
MEALSKRVAGQLDEADERLGLTDYRLSACFGWALYPRDADSADRLVARADYALRQAKTGSKDDEAPAPAARDAAQVSPLPPRPRD